MRKLKGVFKRRYEALALMLVTLLISLFLNGAVSELSTEFSDSFESFTEMMEDKKKADKENALSLHFHVKERSLHFYDFCNIEEFFLLKIDFFLLKPPIYISI